MSGKREFAYEKWLKLLRSIPPLHAVKVRNRYVIVNNYLTHLVRLRYLRRYQFRFRQMKEGCLIFHYSNLHFGRLIKPRFIKKRFYDWDSIFASVPVGCGREIDANYTSIRGAIWQYERQGKLERGEFRALYLRDAKKPRIVICHQSTGMKHRQN
jgi:phage regulator Rha-like protein